MRINLLPHREQARQARQRQFVTLAVLLAVAALAIVGMVHAICVDQIAQVLARKQVVETLQANRNEAVHLLDQLVRQLPDGTYLRSVQQSGAKVTIVGYAQSNARVSTLMRNIDSSPWLEKAELVEVRLVTLPAQGRTEATRVNQFTLTFMIKRATPAPIPHAPGARPAKGA